MNGKTLRLLFSVGIMVFVLFSGYLGEYDAKKYIDIILLIIALLIIPRPKLSFRL
ncbi:hypothetical protein FYL25_03995 [Lactobacillus salivarius]|uniref:Uncharacterized protein n=1 Tax=Ligilactobacillus salivarius TaxID=1624 RepID=A0A6N9IQF7_9LACO|nr:hypothetical protein [Ligilactobacillus salivarius]MYY64596.1 hypothetical protein [Ligilactobacillus salivarius]